MYKIERVVRRSFATGDCHNIPKEGAHQGEHVPHHSKCNPDLEGNPCFLETRVMLMLELAKNSNEKSGLIRTARLENDGALHLGQFVNAQDPLNVPLTLPATGNAPWLVLLGGIGLILLSSGSLYVWMNRNRLFDDGGRHSKS